MSVSGFVVRGFSKIEPLDTKSAHFSGIFSMPLDMSFAINSPEGKVNAAFWALSCILFLKSLSKISFLVLLPKQNDLQR